MMEERNFPQLTQYLEDLKVSQDRESESQATQLARIKLEEEKQIRQAEFEFLSRLPLIRHLKEAALMLSESSVYWMKNNEMFGWAYKDAIYVGITNPKVAPPDYPINLRLAWEIGNYFEPERSDRYRWKEVNVFVRRNRSGQIQGYRFNVNNEGQELTRSGTSSKKIMECLDQSLVNPLSFEKEAEEEEGYSPITAYRKKILFINAGYL